MMRNKKAQVTIFIIIAIIIVALSMLAYSFYPQIRAGLGLEEQSPQTFVQACVEGDMKSVVKNLSIHGGDLDPKNYVSYNDEKIGYLCYTNEYYTPCVMQQPFLKEHMESEIWNNVKDTIETCFDSLEQSYQRKGYNVNLRRGTSALEILPEKISASFNYSLSLSKGESSESFSSFRVVLDNNIYELIGIANSILDWEATYGSVETTTYMDFYHDLKVEKDERADGTTIYILTDRNTGDKFQFASRSMAWPAGY
jgi:hypothetical protein